LKFRISAWTYLGWEQDRHEPPVRYWPRLFAFLGYEPFGKAATLGNQIKAKRRALGLSQRQAAFILSIDQGTLMRYERDEWAPKGDRLRRIDRLLSSSVPPDGTAE
jgi:hypothetical protein